MNLSLIHLLLLVASALSQPFFTSFEPFPPSFIEWDQPNTTYYTGQTLTMNWTSQAFQISDLARIQYVGAGGTRTLTTGSGTNILAGTYALRLSDSTNGLATTIPLTIAHATNTTNTLSSSTRISIVQSKVMNILAFDGNRTLGGGQNAVCDDRNLTVSWRGLGQAQFGVATLSLSKIAGSSGTLGTSVSNLPVSGNMSVSIFCPRTSVPSTFSQYAFQLSIQEPGGTAYTGTSSSFSVVIAPTPSNTPSQTPTSSKTPTLSTSTTPTLSPTPSSSPSNTPSQTPTPSLTPSPSPSRTPSPSTTETARASIDYAAIGRAAAEQVDTTTPAIAGALGGIAGVIVLIGAFKYYQNKRMTEQRKKKLAMTSRWVHQANSMYGMEPSTDAPSIVMYTVSNVPPRKSKPKLFT